MRIAFIALVAIVMAGINMLLGMFVMKIFWAWTIPFLFPMAVEQDLIVSSISWYSAFKLSFFITLIVTILSFKMKFNTD